MLKLLFGPGLDGRDFTDVLLVLFCGLASLIYLFRMREK